MFTGIVEEIGTIESIRHGTLSASFRILASKVLEGVKVGDSINTNGVCLTVTAFDPQGFEVDAVVETMQVTNLKDLVPGSKVNLERALRVGDRLGGHMVSGHVDGTGVIQSVVKEENSHRVTLHTTPKITKYIVKKGSVALDGISLTVTGVQQDRFSVAIIPHTGLETTLLNNKVGDVINIENDISAKYIEKFLNINNGDEPSSINYNYLSEHGFID